MRWGRASALSGWCEEAQTVNLRAILSSASQLSHRTKATQGRLVCSDCAAADSAFSVLTALTPNHHRTLCNTPHRHEARHKRAQQDIPGKYSCQNEGAQFENYRCAITRVTQSRARRHDSSVNQGPTRLGASP
mmetsp:Transcript_29364/g.72054  ORF Transcript_29364/g.72054 Transcript_29364/m.72054 type:complete len:133 (-) Transcript_29364:9-407(-)